MMTSIEREDGWLKAVQVAVEGRDSSSTGGSGYQSINCSSNLRVRERLIKETWKSVQSA